MIHAYPSMFIDHLSIHMHLVHLSIPIDDYAYLSMFIDIYAFICISSFIDPYR